MFSDIVGLYAAYPAWFAGSVLVIGLMVGSFLNVVIYRLPIMMEREWREQIEELSVAPPPSTSPLGPQARDLARRPTISKADWAPRAR